MKLTGRNEDRFTFHLGPKETRLFRELAASYPQIPPARARLTRTSQLPEHEKLLQEALTEQREHSRSRLQSLFLDRQKWRTEQSGVVLTLTAEEVEWLLQVLNDIRVGSWIALGSPENPLSKVDPKTAPRIWMMEMAGYFEMQFLDAVTKG